MSRNMHLIVRPLNEREIPDYVDDKVLAKTYLETAYGMEADAAPYGWDQPPQLYVFRLKRHDANIGSAFVLDGLPIPHFHRLVSEYMSQGGRMHHALLHVAEAWSQMEKIFNKPDLLRDVQGVALVHEGWGLYHEDVDKEAHETARRRELHVHPKRVEFRLVHIAGPNGLRVALHAPRDGVPMPMIGQARPFHPPHEAGVGGDVANAMQYLLETITGLEPGEWSTWWKQYDYDPD